MVVTALTPAGGFSSQIQRSQIEKELKDCSIVLSVLDYLYRLSEYSGRPRITFEFIRLSSGRDLFNEILRSITNAVNANPSAEYLLIIFSPFIIPQYLKYLASYINYLRSNGVNIRVLVITRSESLERIINSISEYASYGIFFAIPGSDASAKKFHFKALALLKYADSDIRVVVCYTGSINFLAPSPGLEELERAKIAKTNDKNVLKWLGYLIRKMNITLILPENIRAYLQHMHDKHIVFV